MARLDLAGRYGVSFEMHADFNLDPADFTTLLREYDQAFRESGLPVVFVDQYRRQSQKHGGVALVYRSETNDTHHVQITYRVSPDLPRTSQLWKIDRMFELMGTRLGVLQFSVSAAFSYPSSEFASRLRLPVRLAPAADSDFDEIRGMRVTKYAEDDKVRYNLVIDYIPETETLYHHVTFSYAGVLESQSVSAAFTAAVGISQSFLAKTEE